jgi:chromosomal replication initiator protein
VWQQCLDIIRDIISFQKFKTWFEPIKPIKLEHSTLTVQVPSPFFYEWLEEYYYQMLRSTISRVMGPEGKLEYSVVVEKAEDMLDNKTIRLPQHPTPPTKDDSFEHQQAFFPGQLQNPYIIPGIQKKKINSNLNPQYVFEKYIEGDCNRLARSAALAISDNPGLNSFNPFFIYGGTGLGKTHLIQSIGNKVKQKFNGDKTVLYITSENFTNEFVHAIRNNRIAEFSMMYRSVDVLIVDDIQFFSGKERTQEEFFHIFNTLHQEGKQIILSSDRAPKDIPDIQERLLSRFNWGLAADLQMPEFETRYAILERKANDNGIEFGKDILEFIALNFKSNVRELEGAIIKLLAMSSLQGVDKIDLPMAKRMLKDMIKDNRSNISIETIQNQVGEYFGFDPNKLKDKTRKQEVVEARQIAMFLAKSLTKATYKTIGLSFGGRDHSTVIHAITTISDQLDANTKLKRTIKDLQHQIELSTI